MKPKLNCNRCNEEFNSKNEQEVDFFRGVDRSRLELCPHCGMFDAHYILERNQGSSLVKGS